jgi:hypothetical protein
VCRDHHCVYVRDGCELEVSFSESYLDMRPLGSHNQTLNRYMINLEVMLSLLLLVFKSQVRTSGDSVYGSEGWET